MIMNFNLYIYLIILLIIVSVAVVMSIVNYKYQKKIYTREIKTDISKNKMIELEKKTQDFLTKNNLEAGCTIEKIAAVLDVNHIKYDNTLKVRACTKKQKNKTWSVFLQPKNTTEELKFDFAHECGHLINEDEGPITRPYGYNKENVEQLADYVGVALLMPLDEVYETLQENDYLKANRNQRLKIIRDLSNTYGLNKVVVLRRINEVYMIKQDM